MNIITAWNKAKEGQMYSCGAMSYKKSTQEEFHKIIALLHPIYLFSDAWVVEKQKMVSEMTVKELRKSNIPNNAIAIVTWEV